MFGAMNSSLAGTTEQRDVQFGQTCTVNQYGILDPATGAPNPSSKTLAFQNDWNQSLVAGLTCSLQVPDKTSPSDLICYVSGTVSPKQTLQITPGNTVYVWFHSVINNGSIISMMDSASFVVDFGEGPTYSSSLSFQQGRTVGLCARLK